MKEDIVDKDVIRSRVFVSCGQKNQQEKMIATEIETRLSQLGYSPYVATHKQSTGSLIKNVLNILKECEYYLFVDFKREKLIPCSQEDLIHIEDKSKQIE